MGIVVKVYIDNNDQEIDIVTLNSDDKKSSSVTITANFIKDYLNKLGNKQALPGCRENETNNSNDQNGSSGTNILAIANNAIDGHEKRQPSNRMNEGSIKRNCDLDYNANQSQSLQCSHGAGDGVVQPFTPDNVSQIESVNALTTNSEDIEPISQSTIDDNPKSQSSNDVQNFVQVIEDAHPVTDGLNESMQTSCIDVINNAHEETSDVNASVAETDTSFRGVDEQSSNCDTFQCSINDHPALNGEDGVTDSFSQPYDSGSTNTCGPLIVDSRSLCVINEANNSDSLSCNQLAVNAETSLIVPYISSDPSSLKCVDVSSSRIVENFPVDDEVISLENGVENVMESLKNVSYEVDDFLNMVNNSPIQNNQLRLSSLPFFVDDTSNSPSSQADDCDEMEEFFIVEKVVATRFNEETKLLEFLLKPQKCVPRKDPWLPTIDSNVNDLTVDPKCLFIQCPKSFRSHKRRRLMDRSSDYIYFVEADRGLSFDIHSEVTSNCLSIVENPPNEEFSTLNASDIVVDPEKSLNDACIVETYADDKKNITPIKNSKSCEDVDDALPSAHFPMSSDMGLGDQVADLLNTKDTSDVVTVDALLNELKPVKSSSPSATPARKSKNLRLYRCPYCELMCSAARMEGHVRRHTKNPLKCVHCDKPYYTERGLKMHEKTHQHAKEPISRLGNHFMTESTPSLPVDEIKIEFESTFDDRSINDEYKEQNVSTPTEFDESTVVNAVDCVNAAPNSDAKPMHARKRKRGRPRRPIDSPASPKRVKEGDAAEVWTTAAATSEVDELCTSSVTGASENVEDAATQLKTADELSERLNDSVVAFDDKRPTQLSSVPNAVEISSKKRREVYCDVCQCSFKTKFDLFWHKEKVHRYPIVLIKRLPF